MSGRLQGKVADHRRRLRHRVRLPALRRRGASVLAVDVNDDSAEETVEKVRAPGGVATAHRADVSSAGDSEAMVAAAESTYGRLDVMFNNAGIMHSGDDDAVSTEEDVWDLTMDINAKGVFLGCSTGSCAASCRRWLDHQHRIVRCPPRGGHSTGCLHRVQGARCWR